MSGSEIDRRIAEREAADRRYNDALTALDRALPALDRASAGPIDVRVDAAGLGERAGIVPGGPPTARGWRGRLAAFIWRTLGPSLTRQEAFNRAAAGQTEELARAVRELTGLLTETRALMDGRAGELATFHSHLVQYLQQITPFVETKIRALEAPLDELRMTAVSAQRSAVAARRELERLAAGGAGDHAAGAPPPPTSAGASGVEYVGFEDLFRGSSDAIRARQAEYADRFAGASDVLDIGCGRGELLELFRERGVTARGIDVNAEMVEVCRARGLDAEQADALAYLSAQPEASLGGLIAAQVVEHLDPAYLMRLLQIAHMRLRPGALIVLETINVACWVAFFESYIRDVTHVRPLHPETLKFLVVAAGFEQVDVHFKSPVEEGGRLQQVGEASVPGELRDVVRTMNANVQRLNDRLFTHLDYAVTGRKAAG